MGKPLTDRYRQWSYSLPYFNHRLRNLAGKYKWCFIDNEPDYADKHPLGYRPNRGACHRRAPFWCFTVPRYHMEDPLYTSCSFENINHIYEEIGYVKAPPKEDDE